jgi:hypothetical protein
MHLTSVIQRSTSHVLCRYPLPQNLSQECIGTSTRVPPSHCRITVRRTDTLLCGLDMHAQPWCGILQPLYTCAFETATTHLVAGYWRVPIPLNMQAQNRPRFQWHQAHGIASTHARNPYAIFRGPCKTDGSLFPRAWDHTEKHACVCTCILTECVAQLPVQYLHTRW